MCTVFVTNAEIKKNAEATNYFHTFYLVNFLWVNFLSINLCKN